MKKDFRFLKVGNKAIVLKDGDVWVVLYANETKSQEFETESEARAFASKVGNESIEKQEWSMFNGLRKDAEKEIGNDEIVKVWEDSNAIVWQDLKSKIYQVKIKKTGEQKLLGSYEKAVKFIDEKTGNKVGNSDTVSEYNAEIQRLTKKAEQLRRMGQGRQAMEVEKQIEKLGKELHELGNKKVRNYQYAISVTNPFGDARIYGEALAKEDYVRMKYTGTDELKRIWERSTTGKDYERAAFKDFKESYHKKYMELDRTGNKKTGNEAPEEMEVKYKGYTITYFPYQKKYMVRHPKEVSGLVQKHFTSVDEAKKAIDKKAIGNEKISYPEHKLESASWTTWKYIISNPDKYDENTVEKARKLLEIKTGNETKGERKFGKVMGEFEEGALKTPQGKTVTDPAQAKAIAYSEADKVDNLKRARNAMNKKVKNSSVREYKDSQGRIAQIDFNSDGTDADMAIYEDERMSKSVEQRNFSTIRDAEQYVQSHGFRRVG